MDIFFGIGAFQSFIFSLLLLTKKNRKSADKYLASFFIVITLYLGNSFSVSYGLWNYFPDIILILTINYLLCGPLLFCYVNSLLNKPISKKQIIYHLIPIAIIFLLIFPFIFQTKEEKLLYFTDRFINLPLNVSIGTFIQYLSAPVYFTWIIIILNKHKKYLQDNLSTVDKINLDWMRKLLIGVITIWLIDCLNVYILNFTTFDLNYNISWYIKFVFMIFIIIIGYYGINQGSVFVHNQENPNINSLEASKELISEELLAENVQALVQHIREVDINEGPRIQDIASNLNLPIDILSHSINVRVKKSTNHNAYEKAKLISDENAIELTKKLVNYMETENPFLNSELRIQDLAVSLDLPVHILSYIINKNLDKNFFDFVNTYRIEEAKRRLKDPSYNNITIVAIAFDCGFNSKATFNRLFKLHTSTTPSQFKK